MHGVERSGTRGCPVLMGMQLIALLCNFGFPRVILLEKLWPHNPQGPEKWFLKDVRNAGRNFWRKSQWKYLFFFCFGQWKNPAPPPPPPFSNISAEIWPLPGIIFFFILCKSSFSPGKRFVWEASGQLFSICQAYMNLNPWVSAEGRWQPEATENVQSFNVQSLNVQSLIERRDEGP